MIVENLARLEDVAMLREPVVTVFPQTPGADGAPVRAVALEQVTFHGV